MLDLLLGENLSPIEKWLKLKDLESQIKLELDLLKDEVAEFVDSGNAEGKVTKVTKETVKTKDSIIQYLQDKDLLRLVKKDEIDMKKLNQLVQTGVIDEDELEEHLERKQSSYLKKGKNN